MKSSYIKLLIRMGAVMAVVLAVAYLNSTDGQIFAIGSEKNAVNWEPVEAADMDTPLTPDPVSSADVAQDVAQADAPSETDGRTDFDEGATPQEGAQQADGAGDADSENPDEPEVEPTDEPEEEITPTPTPSIDPEDPSLYEGLTKLQAAELHASLDESYKKTSDYIKALLVTSDEYYDEAIVAEALAIPTESNDARYEFITGSGYKAYTTSDMPSGFKNQSQAASQMVSFDVPVWRISSSSGKKYSTVWNITINEKLASSVRCIFSDIYMLDIKFPFNYLKGFMYRKVGGSGLVASKLMSAHSFGVAIDINYWDEDNDYYLGKGNDLRNKDNPYCIPDEVIEIFANYGWYWGGNFDICADTMHFQYIGLDFLQYDSDEPFPILSYGADDMSSEVITNLTERLSKLGYMKNKTSHFGSTVDKAVRTFQEDYGLEPDGIVDYETWVPLINATHDMSYVF